MGGGIISSHSARGPQQGRIGGIPGSPGILELSFQAMSRTPLDRLLAEGNFTTHDLVAASPKQLSHKNVQKARKGERPVTDAVARTITDAVNALLQPENVLRVREIFPQYRVDQILP